MKSLQKFALALVVGLSTFALVACGSSEEFDIMLENGDEIVLESELIEITRQELFEEMATASQNGINISVMRILDLVDYDLLSELFDLDEEALEESIDEIRDMAEELDMELENFLQSHGIDSVESLTRMLSVEQLRQTAIFDSIEITEDEIIELYNEWFAASEEEDDTDSEDDADLEESADSEDDADLEESTDSEDDADLEENADSEDDANLEENADSEDDANLEESADSEDDANLEENADSEDDDEVMIPEGLEEHREDIISILRSNALEEPGFAQATLATIRAEAGFTFRNAFLHAQYMEILELNGVTLRDLFSETNMAQRIQTSPDFVATFGEVEITPEDLYDTLIEANGMSTALSMVDSTFLREEFEIDEDEVNETITNLKVDMGDQFFPTMRTHGLVTDQEIFDYLADFQLRDTAFTEAFPIDEDRLQELHEEHRPTRQARHILVETEEEAIDLIARLEEADEDEFEELFIELAMEYSTEPGAEESGGELPPFGYPSGFVVEFEEAAFELHVGEFSTTPVATDFGFHIIYLYDEEEKPSFEDMKEMLEEAERNSLTTTYRIEYMMINLREQFNFTFLDDRLADFYETSVENTLALMEEDE